MSSGPNQQAANSYAHEALERDLAFLAQWLSLDRGHATDREHARLRSIADRYPRVGGTHDSIPSGSSPSRSGDEPDDSGA